MGRWFDCNCGFGVPAKPFGAVFASASELVEELDWCGVGEALVWHVAQAGESPQAGNRLVLGGRARGTGTVPGASGDIPRLHPTWAILPPQTELAVLAALAPFGRDGRPTADREVGCFLTAMKAADVRALRAYPEECHYFLNGLTFGPLLEEMVARRIPLFIGPRWPEVTALLGEFPELTLVVLNHSDWGDDRYFRPLIERYGRLYLDTSNYQLERGLAAFVGRYGPERLLYGSGSPNLQMGAAMLTLAHADMSDEAKAAIAGDNLRRLLSEVKL